MNSDYYFSNVETDKDQMILPSSESKKNPDNLKIYPKVNEENQDIGETAAATLE